MIDPALGIPLLVIGAISAIYIYRDTIKRKQSHPKVWASAAFMAPWAVIYLWLTIRPKTQAEIELEKIIFGEEKTP